MDIHQVTAQNTKIDILNAYHRLKNLLEEQQEKKAAPLRSSIIAMVEKIESSLDEKKAEVEMFNKKIAELKEKLALGEKIRLTEEQLEQLRQTIANERKSWERRQQQLQKELAEEKDWQLQRLEKELNQRRWEVGLEEKKQKRALEEREASFQAQLQEYEQLKKQSADLPEKINREVEKAVKASERKLQTSFDSEKKFLRQEHQAQIKLLEQRIDTLLVRQKEYQEEIGRLTKQLADATTQIKQISVAALQRESLVHADSTKRVKENE